MKGRSVFEITGYTSPDGYVVCPSCVKPKEELNKEDRTKEFGRIHLDSEWDSPPTCDRCKEQIEINCLHTEGIWELNQTRESIDFNDDEIRVEVKSKCVCSIEPVEYDTWVYKRIKDS